MVSIGVHCKSDTAYLALAEDGHILDDPHQQLVLGKGREATDRLVSLMADVERLVTEVKPVAVRVLEPERYEALYARIAPRVAVETVVRVGAARAGANVEMLARTTARSRLGMPKGGKFEHHFATVVAEPVGKYWNAGRNLAAAAALAVTD